MQCSRKFCFSSEFCWCFRVDHNRNLLFGDWMSLIENTTSHFMCFYEWHLITANHVIWLVCMCRWWRVLYLCMYLICKMSTFRIPFCNSNTSSTTFLALPGGRKRKRWGHVLCSVALIILQIYNVSRTAGGAQDNSDKKNSRKA